MAKPNLTVTVYAGPNCRACGAVIAWLKQQGVVVLEKPYTEAPFEVWTLPTIVIGDDVIIGFNKFRLERAISLANNWRRAKP